MKNNKKKITLSLIFLILIAGLVIMGYLFYRKLNDKPIIVEADTNDSMGETVVEEDPKSIYSGNSRPIAVMIDNNIDALPHAGLNKAYMVYEIIVEGGETRLMALFKGKDLDKIGPVRSSRHYFLDYALENDAIYVHYGWSPEAQSDIKTLGINNINGIIDSDVFWRTKDKKAPHNAVTSTKNIMNFAKNNGYRTISNSKSILNYSKNDVELGENAQEARNISIPFSTGNHVKWEYDETDKTYVRYTKTKKEVEWDSGDTDKFKNIIIEFIKNSTLDDGENKGRQTLNTLGNKEGYYITNGKAIKITCSKTSRSSKTVYTDENGKEIEVNDANTFVEICPIDANVTFE